MKTRTGFVSNSSSTSFTVNVSNIKCKTLNEFKDMLRKALEEKIKKLYNPKKLAQNIIDSGIDKWTTPVFYGNEDDEGITEEVFNKMSDKEKEDILLKKGFQMRFTYSDTDGGVSVTDSLANTIFGNENHTKDLKEIANIEFGDVEC